MVFCSAVISSYLSGLNRSPTRTRLRGSGACFAWLAGAWAVAIAAAPVVSAQKNRRRTAIFLGPLADAFAVRHLRADEVAAGRPGQLRTEPDLPLRAARKRRRTDAFAAQLIGTAPFDAPFRDFAARVG